MGFIDQYSDYIILFLTLSFYAIMYFMRNSYVPRKEFDQFKHDLAKQQNIEYLALNKTIAQMITAIEVVKNEIEHMKKDVQEIKQLTNGK